MFGTHPALDEFLDDVDGVRDVNGEDNRLAALAKLVPIRDDVADQGVLVHARGELALVVVAGDGVDASQVRL